jgi:hypothetical protein
MSCPNYGYPELTGSLESVWIDLQGMGDRTSQTFLVKKSSSFLNCLKHLLHFNAFMITLSMSSLLLHSSKKKFFHHAGGTL